MKPSKKLDGNNIKSDAWKEDGMGRGDVRVFSHQYSGNKRQTWKEKYFWILLVVQYRQV